MQASSKNVQGQEMTLENSVVISDHYEFHPHPTNYGSIHCGQAHLMFCHIVKEELTNGSIDALERSFSRLDDLSWKL